MGVEGCGGRRYMHILIIQCTKNIIRHKYSKLTRGVESESVEAHVLRWSRSRFFRYDGVGVAIFFATPTLMLIISYVNRLKNESK